MDGIYHELGRKTDPAKLLGYLNFSDGRPDPRFQKGLADAVAHLTEGGDGREALPWWQRAAEQAASAAANVEAIAHYRRAPAVWFGAPSASAAPPPAAWTIRSSI